MARAPSERNSRISVLGLRRNFGKSRALAIGFAHTDADGVVTINGDGQDDPADIPRLLKALGEESDLVSGWNGISGLVKKKRGRTALRVPGVRVADNLLLRDFTAKAPNTK